MRKAQFLRAYDHWIEDEYRQSAQGLACYRILYVLLTLVFKGTPNYLWLATMPNYLYNPPLFSLGALLPGFPSYPFCFALTIGVAILYVFLLFGFRTRLTGLALFGLLLIGNSFSYSFGKISHDELFALLLPLIMSFSGWGALYSLDATRDRQPRTEGWPITLLALLLGFAMLTAGLPKVQSGWLDPSSSAVQWYMVRRYYGFHSQDYLAPLFAQLQYPFFWEALDYGAVFFELLFLWTVVRRRWFQGFLVLAVGFHLANLLILTISFTANLLIYLLFIDWQPVINLVRKANLQALGRIFSRQWALFIVLLLQIGFVLFRAYAYPHVTENALREEANGRDHNAIVSPLDLMLHALQIQIDTNLLLLLGAVLVVLFAYGAAAYGRYMDKIVLPTDRHDPVGPG